MSSFDRRDFCRAMAMAGIATGQSIDGLAQSVTDEATDVTRKLASWLIGTKSQDMPEAVRREGVRTLLNWVGCALGGARMTTVEISIGAMQPFSGPAQATILGRTERLDILSASLVNGISSHALDFDDTHLKTVIHPGGPVASAILALSEFQPVSGRDFLHALILGSRSNAGSATRSIRSITTRGGTSRARRVFSVRRPPPDACWV